MFTIRISHHSAEILRNTNIKKTHNTIWPLSRHQESNNVLKEAFLDAHVTQNKLETL